MLIKLERLLQLNLTVKIKENRLPEYTNTNFKQTLHGFYFVATDTKF